MTNSKICELINENSFKAMLTNELYAIIDEELAKGDEMDCELIDELVLAIESLEQTEDEKSGIIFPIIFGDATGFSKRVINKVNNRNRLMQLTAWAAVIAILLSGTNELLLRSENTTLVGELSKFVQNVSKYLTGTVNKNEEETTTSPAIVEEETPLPLDDKVEQPEEVKLMSLELVVSENFKRSYLWQEKLDLNGLDVVAVYSNGARTAVNIDKCKVTGFDSLKVGEQTITVEYKGIKKTFKVTVAKTEQNNTAIRTITNIECNAKDKQIIVPMGTENPAVHENVKYRYVYSDGTFSAWTNCKDATLIGDYDPTLLDKEQTVTYKAPNGMKFSITVIVYDNTVPEEKVVKKLEIKSYPKGFKYYADNHSNYYAYVDENIDFSQFSLNVIYDDRTSEILTLNESEIKTYGTMTTERPSSYSRYTITFAYGDVTVEFKYDVIIKPELFTYKVNDKIWQTFYINDAPAEFPASSLVIAKMNDSNNEVYLDVEVRGYDPTKIGYIELELYYEGEKLCDYIGGYIYGDTGYAVVSRPITDGVASSPFNFKPYVVLYKCMGDGKFETYGDIKHEISDKPINDPSVIFESGTSGELKAMGITSYKCVCIDSSVVEYVLRADEYITEFGTHEAKVYLYNVEPIYSSNGKWVERWKRTGIAEDLSYTITIKEKAHHYRVEAPRNIKINIQDIYSEFYDKVHVFAVYKDGREEEIFDYDIMRYLPSRPTTSARLRIYLQYPDGNETFFDVYAYSEGYEDSFFINMKDTRPVYDNYYAVGAAKPLVQIDFASASQSQISYITTNSSSPSNTTWSVEGWDTLTPGEKEATIIYHSPIGDMKATYKYIVIPEYNENYLCKIEFNDGGAYDIRYGLVEGTYKVIHTDLVGRTYEITDYYVGYSSSSNYNQPRLAYMNPDPDVNADSSNPRPDGYIPIIEKFVGKVENIQGEVLENGDVKISMDCPYLPVNGTMKYLISYPARKGTNGGITYEIIESDTTEIIIPRDIIYLNGEFARFKIYATIVDDETGKEFRHYEQEIKIYFN